MGFGRDTNLVNSMADNIANIEKKYLETIYKLYKESYSWAVKNVRWIEYFLNLAELACHQSKMLGPRGSAIAKGKRVIMTGFNGFPENMKDSEENLWNKKIHFEYGTHSEINAIENALRNGIKSLKGCTLYHNNCPPCPKCAQEIINQGIRRVVFPVGKKINIRWVDMTLVSLDNLQRAGVKVVPVLDLDALKQDALGILKKEKLKEQIRTARALLSLPEVSRVAVQDFLRNNHTETAKILEKYYYSEICKDGVVDAPYFKSFINLVQEIIESAEKQLGLRKVIIQEIRDSSLPPIPVPNIKLDSCIDTGVIPFNNILVKAHKVKVCGN